MANGPQAIDLSRFASTAAVCALGVELAEKQDVSVPTASEVWAGHLARQSPRAAKQRPSWKRG